MVETKKKFPHNKVLVIRFSSIGDIVLTSPVVRSIKKDYPECEIHFVTKKQYFSIIKNSPYIDKIFLLEDKLSVLIKQLKAEKYDLVIDLHKNIRSLLVRLRLRRPSIVYQKNGIKKRLFVKRLIKKMSKKHVVERYFDLIKKVGVNDDKKGLDFFIDKQEEEKLKQQLPKKFVAFVIGSGYFTRSFPLKKWHVLVDKLYSSSFNHRIVLLGGMNEKEDGNILNKTFPDIINLCGQLSLQESAVYVKHASLVVTNDTGLSHVAAAFNKKIISIWGGATHDFGFYPFRVEHVKYFQIENLDCRPCSSIGKKYCPKGHFNCMNLISEEEMAKSILQML